VLGAEDLDPSTPRPLQREALACFETAAALGWLDPLPEDLAAMFHPVVGTLVRLIEPKA
jgi:hypothetical protein